MMYNIIITLWHLNKMTHYTITLWHYNTIYCNTMTHCDYTITSWRHHHDYTPKTLLLVCITLWDCDMTDKHCNVNIIIVPPQFSNNNNARPARQVRLGEYNFTQMRIRGIYNYEAKPQHGQKNSQELMENVGRKIVAQVKCLITRLQPIMPT